MSREWKPGDVGITGDKYGDETPARFIVITDADGKVRFVYADGDAAEHPPREDARPLVVIDPEDREQVARLADAFCTERWSHIAGSDECDPLTRSSMTAALRSLVDPPRPEEPTGLGAVVEVPSTREGLEGETARIVRGHATNQPWMGDGVKRNWEDLPMPITVLHPGVTA